MARLPYPDLDRDPELAALAERVRAQRGGRLLNLYRMLLHSPPVAEGWLAYLTAIRQKARLPGRLRELVVLRVALLNGADYEHAQHVPYARREGVSAAQIAALGDWRSSGHFDPAERAVLELTDAMTREVRVPAAVARHVATILPPREVVELVATVAAYNMVSRFLVALEIDHDAPASRA